MAVRLKTHSHLMARLGAIKSNTISHCGFFTSPPGLCLGKSGQLCLHDCVHLKLHDCWVEVN